MGVSKNVFDLTLRFTHKGKILNLETLLYTILRLLLNIFTSLEHRLIIQATKVSENYLHVFC